MNKNTLTFNTKGAISLAEEIITWAQSESISKQLLEEAAVFEESMLEKVSTMQGLYFLCYTGTELGGTLWKAPEPAVIYIGRAGKDSPRHWLNDTGISTVRRSLAAMLANSLQLTSVPGAEGADPEDRYANYALAAESEDKLTEWMHQNIRVAFLDVEADRLDATYRALINYNTPKLNFQDNPNNTFGQQIKAYRKLLTDMAATNQLGK